MKVNVIDVIHEFYTIKESSDSLQSKPNQYRKVLEKILKYIMGIDLGEFHSLSVLVDHVREYPMSYSLKLNTKTRKLALYFNKWSHSNDSYFDVSEFEEHQHELEDLMDLVFETNCKELRSKTSSESRESEPKNLSMIPDVNKKMYHKTPNSMKSPSYQSTRLLFKKSVIEPLQMTDKFSIHVTTTNETFTMSKAEFYQTFQNVAYSDSYSKGGSYSYTNIPDKAYKYLAPTINTEFNPNRTVTGNGSDALNQIKIGRLIKEFFKENGGKLSPVMIQNLQSKEYSKRELGCNFPVLIPKTNSKVVKGYNRYYKDEFVTGYWLCSQWYEWDKEKFLQWKSNL